MKPLVPPGQLSGWPSRRPRPTALRSALIGIVLLCVTACGAAGAAPAEPAEANAGTTTVGSGSISTAISPPAGAGSAAPLTSTSPPAPTSTAPPAAASSSPAPPAVTAPPVPAALVLPASSPVSVTVPAIGINSPLIELGRNPDGTVEVPSLDDPDSKPGWYRNSPSPGALGPAIILGHVDSRAFGPGVFYSLQDLQPGDPIDVARADGTVAEFAVDSVQTVQKSDFPTLQVYGNLDHAGLRLITCGGEFDPNARSYESNIIVFASLVGSRSA